MNARAKHHMTYLAAGAEMASRHARALPFRPPFPTAAVDELRDAEAALEEALQKVRAAMIEYNSKPLEIV
jgi:Histidine kinase